MDFISKITEFKLLESCDIHMKLSKKDDLLSILFKITVKEDVDEKVKAKIESLRDIVISGTAEEINKDILEVFEKGFTLVDDVITNIDDFVEKTKEKTSYTPAKSSTSTTEKKEKLNKTAQNAIKKGDEYMKKKQFINARLFYRNANDAQPGSKIIADKLKEVEDAIKKASGSQGDMFAKSNEEKAPEKKEEVKNEVETESEPEKEEDLEGSLENEKSDGDKETD